MRALRIAAVASLLVLAACDPERGVSEAPAPEPKVEASPGSTTEEATPRAAVREVQIYAAVVRQVVSTDHTFSGDGEIAFDQVLISRTIGGDRAGLPSVSRRPEGGTPMPVELAEALAAELADLPQLRFVAYRDAVEPEGALEENHAAVVSLGPIPEGNRRVKVKVGMLCGGLCGTWLTYVVVAEDGGWRVTGTTGPVAIA